MKVALIHDYLNQYGGGERVLEALMEIFPDALIYTLFHDAARTHNKFKKRIARTSFLNFPLARRHHRLFIPLMPAATRQLKIPKGYDVVISDSAGFAKGVAVPKETLHISYIHTPLRYAWETETYFPNRGFTTLFQPAFRYLRNWDYRAGQMPHALLANSHFIAGKIKRYYNRDAAVLYPPVDTKRFYREPKSKVQNYYLAVGRLLHYKRFDLVAQVFMNLGLPLKIVGDGPEYQNLASSIKHHGAKNIELIPFVKDENELRKLYSGAKALVFPQVEDFGLVAAEAQACGCPVIAYAGGGALEIVNNGKTGILFHQQNPHALINAIRDAEKQKWNRAAIARSARRFAKDKFKKTLYTLVQKIVRGGA